MSGVYEKILIVDDERTNINLLVNILKPDYRTIIAKNGEEALRRANADSPPDLILLDIMMPGMDGYEVCRKLKNGNRTRLIPLIFITAKNDVIDEIMGLECGAIDYLTKPISPPIVKARIKNHLDLKHAHEQIEQQRHQLELQNAELKEAVRLREDMEQITRHDLKNPLNAIINLPEVIREHGGLNEQQLQYLRIIETSAYKMLNMVNRSLDVFKMERGIYNFQPVSVNLALVIVNILKELQRPIEKRQLAYHILHDHIPVNLQDCEFLIYGEELLCYSMLTNLLKNAIEASPDRAAITISLNRNTMAEIQIHNMGEVPPDIQDKFFEKFITFGKKTGTGLGHIPARLIAETHGGKISLDTSPESGTTVTVTLPVPE